MDSNELNKVANRKKISSDVEKVRVQRERRNIIKLRVAQDTVYWDVKENLRQTETSHEKLQQNMVELPMQHETVSGKYEYQDKIRLHPETFEQLASTHEVCDVVEGHTERLRDFLSRCKAEQVSLSEPFQKSGQVVRDPKDAIETQTNAIDLRISNEHNAQTLQFYNYEKQRIESELQDIKTKLSEAGKVNEELFNAGRDLNRQLEACCRDLQKKEESTKALQNEIKQMCDKFNAQTTEINHALHKEKELNKEKTCNIEALQQALANQETYTNSVVSQNNSLEEKLADLGNEVTKKDDCINQMQDNIQNMKAANEDLVTAIANINEEKKCLQQEIEQKNENMKAANEDLVTAIANINEEKKCLQQEIEQKNEAQRNMEVEILNLTRQLSILEMEKADTGAELSRTMNEMKIIASRVQELTSVSRDLHGEVQKLEEKMQVEREGIENYDNQLMTTLEEKERDLVNKDCTITKLMGDVKNGLDFQSELKSQIQKLEQDLEIQRQKTEEQMAQIKEKDNDLRTKDQEFKELRTVKERLKSKIASAKETFSRRNAIMLTPSENTEPRPAAAVNDDFIVVTDSSGDDMDPQELKRGEKLPPIPSSALKKRRSPDTPSTTEPRYKRLLWLQEDDVPLSEITAATGSKKAKDRVFFKNKRRRGDSSKR